MMDEIKAQTLGSGQVSPSPSGDGKWLWLLLLVLLVALGLILWWVIGNFKTAEPETTSTTITEEKPTDLSAEERSLLEIDLDTELDTSEIDTALN